MEPVDVSTEDLLRELSPQVLGALVRRYGHFDLAEDAVQEALLAATLQWPDSGRPDAPRAWLIAVASRRLTDLLRAEQARRRREDRVAAWTLPDHRTTPPADDAAHAQVSDESDDSLILLFLCCHPSLTQASQIALTLRAVGGLTTAEIARAFLVPEQTMTRRITRAKQQIADSRLPFRLPAADERASRLGAVLHVLYLIFNEGYASTAGPRLHRVELSAEAIRLARMAHLMLPDVGEVGGLLALMLLTDARRPARTGPGGEVVPMDEQDRSLWVRPAIEEGVALVAEVLPRGTPGPYQVQAAIAALHDEAPTAADTDWPQIVALYEVLLRLSDNPMVALNQAVAVGMASSPEEGLLLVEALADDDRIGSDHRFFAVRAGLLEMTGDRVAARAAFLEAARRTTSLPLQRYLHLRASRLA